MQIIKKILMREVFPAIALKGWSSQSPLPTPGGGGGGVL